MFDNQRIFLGFNGGYMPVSVASGRGQVLVNDFEKAENIDMTEAQSEMESWQFLWGHLQKSGLFFFVEHFAG